MKHGQGEPVFCPFGPVGITLLVTVVIFMIGASSAAYFRRWPLPADPLEKLTVIANDRLGWAAQAILFPVAFLATAIIFGGVAVRLPGPWPRTLAIAATILCAAGALLWLPISAHRLQLGTQAANLIRTFDPAVPPTIMPRSTFWPHTLSILAAITLMGGVAGASQHCLRWAGSSPRWRSWGR